MLDAGQCAPRSCNGSSPASFTMSANSLTNP